MIKLALGCSLSLMLPRRKFSLLFRCRLSNLSMRNDESSVNLSSNEDTFREICSDHVKSASWQEAQTPLNMYLQTLSVTFERRRSLKSRLSKVRKVNSLFSHARERKGMDESTIVVNTQRPFHLRCGPINLIIL